MVDQQSKANYRTNHPVEGVSVVVMIHPGQ